jgi:hypothetical protein
MCVHGRSSDPQCDVRAGPAPVDLVGWVPATEAASAGVANELARLSQENHLLRSAAGARESFDGLQFDELVALLRQDTLPEDTIAAVRELEERDGLPLSQADPVLHVGHLFESLQDPLSRNHVQTPREYSKEPDPNVVMEGLALGPLIPDGLVMREKWYYELTPLGRRFRSRLLLQGALEERLSKLWASQHGI